MNVADLYAEPPERFVAARDALADSLREEDPAAARKVKKLRRPTVALWALNQVAPRERATLERFLAGEGRDRSLLARLAKAATSALTETHHEATPSQLRRIEETLLAAPLAPDEDRRALLEGRLDHPIDLGDIDTLLALAASRGEKVKRGAARTKEKPAREAKPEPSAAERAAERGARRDARAREKKSSRRRGRRGRAA